MPESVTDRPTKAHEYLFLLTKAERYYYDAPAIAEAVSREFWDETVGAEYMTPKDGRNDGGKRKGSGPMDGTRNKRSVWEIATAPFAEAHFATFPPALIEPCIKAGTSERGCCAKCGAPWEREVEQIKLNGNKGRATQVPNAQNWAGYNTRTRKDVTTLGWSPSCSCDATTIPATVLDPFGGAGTTGLVADRLQRNAILIELNPEYAAMARRRIDGDAPLFSVAPPPLGSSTERSSVELGLQGVEEAL